MAMVSVHGQKGEKMAKTQMVTIPIEEYKELLLKDKPTDKDRELCERILGEIAKNLKYTEKEYYSNCVGDNMEVEHPGDVITEIMRMLKYVDFDRYMKMWNSVMTNERNRKAMNDKLDQMNRAKDLRNSDE